MIRKIYNRIYFSLKKPLNIIVLAATFVVLSLFLMRYVEYKKLCKSTDDIALTHVRTVSAKQASAEEKIRLPGKVLAWHEAFIFARSKGYLKEWLVDIGYKVHKGDVLAIIERPELDAELREAEDYLKVVTAQYKLAQITAKRWGELVKTDSVSKQSNDNKKYSAAAYLAELQKARANLQKLRAFVSFDQVIAPFDGIISLRDTDIGMLINIGSYPSENKPLFKIVQTNPLRLYINIPQMYSARLSQLKKVNLIFKEHPGKVFSAELIKISGGMNPETMTIQGEFKVENKDGLLIPGSYAMVEFSIPNIEGSVILPVNTLIFRAKGLQVAIVHQDNRVFLKNIEIGTDMGAKVQINSGLKPGEQIVVNPPDNLLNNERVKVVNRNLSISPGKTSFRTS